MIPFYIKRLADLICPHWADLDEDEIHEVINAAYRVHGAGYRQPLEREDTASEGSPNATRAAIDRIDGVVTTGSTAQ